MITCTWSWAAAAGASCIPIHCQTMPSAVWMLYLHPMTPACPAGPACPGCHDSPCHPHPPFANPGDPLERIAPGLTASGLCPLAKTNPQAAIDAIAQGSKAAYYNGQGAQNDYAQAMGAAVGAAASNGCINEVFEIVNQAIIKGGFPTEFVVGRALAAGTAQGVDSETGEVLAKATAVVICRGGESASACARAWAQAIKMDSNGCLVLVKAYAHAKAQCGPGYATSQVKATVFKEPLGVCNAPGLYSNPPPAPEPQKQAPSAPAPAPYKGWSVNQGPGGQSVNGDGMSINQGWGGQGAHFWGKRLLSVAHSGDQQLEGGRAATHFLNAGRRMLKGVSVVAWSGDGGAKANANSFAGNTGDNYGDLFAGSNAAAFGQGAPATAQANSAAVNKGNVGGSTRAVSNAVAVGR